MHLVEPWNQNTWPADLKATLGHVREITRAYELDLPGSSLADYEWATGRIAAALAPCHIRGWHCTRLTAEETDGILKSGLQPLSPELIAHRIKEQVRVGTLSSATADTLRSAHQAGQANRAGMIWFCFFPPVEAGEGAISRLLTVWGGEATYWAHSNNRTVLDELRQLGAPAMVEVEVPFALIVNTFTDLSVAIARRDLVNHGIKIRESLRSEGYICAPLAAQYVRAVHRFPSDAFDRLSGCKEWHDSI